MHRFGLIRENLDGLEAPTTKFVMRSTPHTLAMTPRSATAPARPAFDDGDQRVGWFGRRRAGRGTLNEFVFGAIVQHFPRTLNRKMAPTSACPPRKKSDAIEAFQLFSAGSGLPHPGAHLRRRRRQQRRDKALNRPLRGLPPGSGRNATTPSSTSTPTPSRSRARSLPIDGGFGPLGTFDTGFGTGRFNVPPLARPPTPPVLHNGLIEGLEDAITFYISPNFAASPAHQISVRPTSTTTA